MEVEAFVLDHDGVGELLKCPEMQAILREKTDYIMAGAKANRVYEDELQIRPTRAVGVVRVGDKDTYFREMHDNQLLKLLKGAK